MGKVWVGGKYLDTSNKKADKWKPPPPPPPVLFCECDDCGEPIYKTTACWQIGSRVVCWDCHEGYMDAGIGYQECAGLNLPAVMLEG